MLKYTIKIYAIHYLNVFNDDESIFDGAVILTDSERLVKTERQKKTTHRCHSHSIDENPLQHMYTSYEYNCNFTTVKFYNWTFSWNGSPLFSLFSFFYSTLVKTMRNSIAIFPAIAHSAVRPILIHIILSTPCVCLCASLLR